MNIDHDAFEKVSVIRVSGDLGCMSADALRQTVYSLLARGHRTILVNFANVARIDAAGLGTLAQVHRLATIVGAVVTLTNIHPRVRELLDLAGLAACFDISASECEALEDPEPCALT
jgi:anti-anti-sigma factor